MVEFLSRSQKEGKAPKQLHSSQGKDTPSYGEYLNFQQYTGALWLAAAEG